MAALLYVSYFSDAKSSRPIMVRFVLLRILEEIADPARSTVVKCGSHRCHREKPEMNTDGNRKRIRSAGHSLLADLGLPPHLTVFSFQFSVFSFQFQSDQGSLNSASPCYPV